MDMNAYTINQQLDSLYKDLEAAHNNDEEAVCLMFNADSKKEAIQLITDEIDSLEDSQQDDEKPYYVPGYQDFFRKPDSKTEIHSRHYDFCLR